jgi:hypothetical protein
MSAIDHQQTTHGLVGDSVTSSPGTMQSPWCASTGIDDDQVIMKSIALGSPDDFPTNAVAPERRPVDKATGFIGY